jgi:signal transduction histidine kinase
MVGGVVVARRLKATGNHQETLQGNLPVNSGDVLNLTKHKYVQKELFNKITALERLSGVRNSSKTHYSELKKSMADMQKCNLFLTESQQEVGKLYQLLKKKAEQTLAILEISRAVSNILPFDQILEKTNNLVSKVLGPVECQLFDITDGDPLSLKPYVPGQQQNDFIKRLRDTNEFWQTLINDKNPVRFEDNNTEFLVIPLVSRGDVNGILIIRREINQHFTSEEIELCLGIANPVAVAIENRTLVEKLETESTLLKTALLSLKMTSDNIAMLDQGVEPILQAVGESLLRITNAKYGVILTRGDRLVSLHVPERLENTDELDKYLFSWLDKFKLDKSSCDYEIRQLQLENDTNLVCFSTLYGFKEALIFPMTTKDKTLGLILLFFHQYKNDVRSHSILQVLGNQTAIVLENAKLFEDTLNLKDQAESHYKMVCAQKEQLEQKNNELKHMYNILFRSREEQIIIEERNRIAADLHDNVLQILFVIGLHFEWCTENLPATSPVYSKLKYLDQLVGKAVNEIRQVVTEFSSKEPYVSLQSSIETLVRDLNQAGSTSITVKTIGTLPTLPSVVRNIAFRIVQEALVNALRHSGATVISIQLEYADKKLQVSVTDNGVGIFENILVNIHKGNDRFGLKNMIQRAQYVNGTVHVSRLNSGGTVVLLEIPI